MSQDYCSIVSNSILPAGSFDESKLIRPSLRGVRFASLLWRCCSNEERNVRKETTCNQEVSTTTRRAEVVHSHSWHASYGQVGPMRSRKRCYWREVSGFSCLISRCCRCVGSRWRCSFMNLTNENTSILVKSVGYNGSGEDKISACSTHVQHRDRAKRGMG